MTMRDKRNKRRYHPPQDLTNVDYEATNRSGLNWDIHRHYRYISLAQMILGEPVADMLGHPPIVKSGNTDSFEGKAK